MSVKYVFIDGSEKVCSIPLETPISLIPSLLSNHEQGLVAVEILSVSSMNSKG